MLFLFLFIQINYSEFSQYREYHKQIYTVYLETTFVMQLRHIIIRTNWINRPVSIIKRID